MDAPNLLLTVQEHIRYTQMITATAPPKMLLFVTSVAIYDFERAIWRYGFASRELVFRHRPCSTRPQILIDAISFLFLTNPLPTTVF